MRGDVFKGDADMRSWAESNLPLKYPFGVFVDVYVILKLVLLGHTNVQATTMERNQKLSLEADEVLVLKTFENKLPTLFGRSSSSHGAAIKMVTSTKDIWLPRITSFGQWETSN
eukprot:15335085-Ditylum_brightwellii.AAC.1